MDWHAILTLSLAWYLFIGGWLYLLHRMTGCLRRWNTFTLFAVALLLHHGVGVPFSLAEVGGLPGRRVEIGPLWLLNLALMYALLLVGAGLANLLFRRGSLDDESSVVSAERSPGVSPLFWGAIAVGITLIGFRLSSIELPYSLYDFFLGVLTFDEYSAIRGSYAAAPLGEEWLVYSANVFQAGVLPAVLYFLMFRVRAGALYWPLLGLVGTMYGYMAVLSAQKALILTVVLGVYVAWEIGFRGGRVRLDVRAMTTGAGLLFLGLPYLFMAQYSGMGYLEALERTWYRLAVEPNRGLQMYFYTFPHVHKHLYGTSSWAISALLGIPRDERVVPHTLIPLDLFGIRETTWNVAFVGDAWADFGWLGVITASLAVGMLCQWYNIWFARTRRTALVVAVYSGLVVAAIKLVQVGTLTALFTFGFGTLFAFYAVVREPRWLTPGHRGRIRETSAA